jgi:alpha-L-fucosidase
MGARVAALTSKHEKGFCLWPSKYSNFTIAHSPTVGHRDLVREFTDECRKQGIKPGLYLLRPILVLLVLNSCVATIMLSVDVYTFAIQ